MLHEYRCLIPKILEFVFEYINIHPFISNKLIYLIENSFTYITYTKTVLHFIRISIVKYLALQHSETKKCAKQCRRKCTCGQNYQSIDQIRIKIITSSDCLRPQTHSYFLFLFSLSNYHWIFLLILSLLNFIDHFLSVFFF